MAVSVLSNSTQDQINGLSNAIGNTSMGTTATTLTGAIAEHETDISNLNSKLNMHMTDGGTDLSSYTNVNKYVAPTDGYVFVYNSSSTTGYLLLYDGYFSIGGSPGRFSCFVRKGTLMYVNGTCSTVRFHALKS